MQRPQRAFDWDSDASENSQNLFSVEYDDDGLEPKSEDDESGDNSEEDEVEEDGSDEKEEDEELFSFRYDERRFVWALTDSVRCLLTRRTLSARQICEIGHLIFALERLPRTTENFSMQLRFELHAGEGDLWFCELSLSSDEFNLTSGGWTDEGMGSESYSSMALSVGCGWRDSDNDERVGDWLDTFKGYVESETQAIIDNNMDMPFEWDSLDIDENEKPLWPRKQAVPKKDE